MDENRILRTSTITILVGLVTFTSLALVMRVFCSNFDPTPYIAAISTLCIAFLTTVYVITTSGQLKVMRGQLEEMRQSRQLESQPLPIVSITKVEIEPPRLFYTPPEDLHSFHTRLRIEFSIKNHSQHPAVNIVSSSAIIISSGDTNSLIRCTSEHIDILAGTESYPSNGEDTPDFLYTSDRDEKILASLRQRSPKELPTLAIHMCYTNILGACFSIDGRFRLVPKSNEDGEILKKWHSLTTSFPVEYKDDLKRLGQLRKDKKDKEWDTLFNTLKNKLQKITGTDLLKIEWFRLPNSFKVQTISTEEYNKEIEQTGFGRRIPDWCMSDCKTKTSKKNSASPETAE